MISQNRQRSHGGNESHNPSGKLLAMADAEIPAKSGLTLGSGTVSIYRFVRPGSAVIEDTGENKTAYNTVSAPIAAGVLLQIAPEKLSGNWLIDVQDCEAP